jgi:hypothetical protein
MPERMFSSGWLRNGRGRQIVVASTAHTMEAKIFDCEGSAKQIYPRSHEMFAIRDFVYALSCHRVLSSWNNLHRIVHYRCRYVVNCTAGLMNKRRRHNSKLAVPLLITFGM